MKFGRFYHLAQSAAACLALLLACVPLGAVEVDEGPAVAAAPPRSIEDVARLLEQYRPDPEAAAAARRTAEGMAPETTDRRTLFEFYRERARAAGQLGRVRQQIADLRQAREFAERGSVEYVALLRNLSAAESAGGNMLSAVRLVEEALREIPEHARGQELGARQQAVLQYASLGDFTSARQHLQALEKLFSSLRRSPAWTENVSLWTASYERARARIFMVEGSFPAAAEALRKALRGAERWLADMPGRQRAGADPQVQDNALRLRVSLERELATALLGDYQLVEAEVAVRQAIRHALELAGRGSADTAMGLSLLSRIVAEQGRNGEAARLAAAAVDSHRLAGAAADSLQVAAARRALGSALVADRRYGEALQVFDEMREGLRADPELLDKVGSGDLDWVLAMLRSARPESAERMAGAMLAASLRRFGDKDVRTAEVRAFHAMALAALGRTQPARQAFVAALPVLVDQARSDLAGESGGIKRQQRLSILIESYLRLLASLRQGAVAPPPDVVGESFRLADIARGSSVQRAMAASAARFQIDDPQLADLARREQDARRRANALAELLRQLLSAPPEQQLPAIQGDLRRDIGSLREEARRWQREIESRYPDYAELIDPKPMRLEQARRHLRPGEVLAAWYFGEEEGYVWAVGEQGEPAFAVVPLRRSELAAAVAGLRRSLDPGVADIADIPPFDVAAAYRLYRLLLAPVQSVWADARVLLAVPHAELGQLPLALLPTAEIEPPAAALPFAGYRRVPWLLRRVAIAQLPAVTALASLRRLPPGGAGRRAFIGFGDPLFSREQAGEAGVRLAMNTRGGSLRLRLRASPRTSQVDSAEIALLPRLPDTGEEIREVGRVLAADPERDIFLQLRATEAAVEGSDLAQRRVVMFATHGLVPGELNGLTQPALALTAPQLAGGSGDGLLTMDRILGLKLDADWVVLSACNTAAGDGAGSEAVSGLGRAFFYAGARALLVSNWPVETVAARLLMTELFRRQAEGGGAAKAEVLRAAMLALLDGPGRVDPESGRVVYSYAHPLFWAPFVIVGD